jgi:hypothetical protein
MITQSIVRFFNTVGDVVKSLIIFNQEETKRKFRKSVHKQLDHLIDFADSSENKYKVHFDLMPETKGTIDSVINDSLDFIDSEIRKKNEDEITDDEMETGYYIAFKNKGCREIAELLKETYNTIRGRKQRLFDITGFHDVLSFSEHFRKTYPDYLPPQH